MELVPRNIFYCREELSIYHLKASEITGLKGAEHESVFLRETVVSSFFWWGVSGLEIVGFLPAAFHLVSGWIWWENGRKIPVSFRREYSFHFRAISGDFRPFYWNAPENALDPAVSDRTYLTWLVPKSCNSLIYIYTFTVLALLTQFSILLSQNTCIIGFICFS